jgi:choline monooxygenase
VTRGEDGVVRVLSNVCRHRANIVAEGSGNRKRFTCSYHAWTYASDGRLITAPLMDKAPDFHKERCGLPVLRSTLWNDFIFVNLDSKAAPLEPQLAPLDKLLVNYHLPERHHVYAVDDVWHTNWKCLTENFMEGYHLSATHLKTLHPITPTTLCEKLPGNQAYTAYRSHFNPNYPDRGPFHDDLTFEEKRSSLLFCVFPSFVVSIAPHFTLYVCLRPLDADRVALRWGLAGHVDGPDQPEVKNYIELCNAFNAEDKEKLETLQKAMKTRYYQSGPLAPADYEGTIWDIYQFMASRLAAEPASAVA